MSRNKESGSGSKLIKEKRTRRRTIKCCENCRSSKSKCLMYPNPCSRCLLNKLECVYLPQDDEGWHLIEKGKEEHQKIHNKVAKKARREEDSEDGSENGSDIEPSPLITTDAAYEDDDDFEDNGLRIIHMLDINDSSRSDYDRQVFSSLPKPHWLDAAAGSRIFDPHPAYIAPSLFSHTLQVSQHIHHTICSQDIADKVMSHYWESVHPVACVVHRPSFQERYDVFWYNTSRGVKDTPESTRALVYAAVFAGVVSMDAKTVREELGGEKEEWVEALEKATAISLGRAHVIRTEKPETIQAFVVYLIPMCRSVVSRTLATLVASAIDLARGMGLNRDGTRYGHDAVVTQVHRMIWHQLCFLDIRVCEAQSPRARIRKDEFDTQFPLNIDDSELEKAHSPDRGNERWTGMTLPTARMECNEKIREIYAAQKQARQGNDSGSAYIKKILEMIDEFQQYMEKKYYPMIDDRIPIQHYTRLVIDLHCRRMHAMLLHEYHMSTPRGRLPEQWSRIVIKSGLETMEIAKEIETSRFLRQWRWYAGALQQHHYATLMLVEVAAYPEMEYATRAWESLDWIFQVPSCIPLSHKARWVLEGVVGVCKEYRKERKLRYPTVMDERLGIAPSSPFLPTSLKRRKIAVRPTTTATMAHSWAKSTSHRGQYQVNSQDQALSQMPVTSNMRAGFQDMEMTFGAQAMATEGVMYESKEQMYNVREPTVGFLLASAPHPAKLERLPSEEDSHLPTPPDSAVEHSGNSFRDNVTMPPTYQGSRVAEDGRGAVGGISRARSPDYAHDHSIYYPHPTWNRTTAPLPNPPYIPTGNDNWHNPIPHDHSHSDPHNNSQIINEEGTFVHHRNHHPPSSIPAGASAFTPINQYYNPVPYPFPQYRTPYAGNDIPLLGPQNKRPLQPKEFRNVGPRDFEEPRRPQKRRWRI